LQSDDFNAEYSPANYLRRLPIDRLKVGRTLVAALPEQETAMRSVIDLAHSRGMVVVAEGIESAERRDHVHALGCDAAQGNFIAPPSSATETRRWVMRKNAARIDGSQRISAGSEVTMKSPGYVRLGVGLVLSTLNRLWWHSERTLQSERAAAGPRGPPSRRRERSSPTTSNPARSMRGRMARIPAKQRVVTASDAQSGKPLSRGDVSGGADGGWLTRFFMPGYQSMYVSFYVRFPRGWTGGTKLAGFLRIPRRRSVVRFREGRRVPQRYRFSSTRWWSPSRSAILAHCASTRITRDVERT
jgi:hypothetical protein